MGSMPPGLQRDLQTRRRRAMDVTVTVHNEDGSVECDVGRGPANVDPGTVYELQFSMDRGSGVGEGGSTTTTSAGNEHGENDVEATARTTLGENGWHRALEAVMAADDSQEVKSDNSPRKTTSSSSTKMEQLDQLTVTHILQSLTPRIDEYDAIRDEHAHLLDEIRSLENDRVQLEQLFHAAGRDATSRRRSIGKKDDNDGDGAKQRRMTYRQFRSNMRYMKAGDMRTLPTTWLEDVPLSCHDDDDDDDDIPGNSGKQSHRSVYAKLDEKFAGEIRDHRGAGLALLISDPQCKASLIERCHAPGDNHGPGNGRHPPTKSAMMPRRQRAATLMDEGGRWLRHCAITGLGKANHGNNGSARRGDHTDDDAFPDNDELGTTYFLKFDDGKSHHRGDLPANLSARLLREGRARGGIRYLSTGCSHSSSALAGATAAAARGGGRSGGHRCYYAEFDDGECWWGTGERDDVLDGIFTEMDVHRVAFGLNGSGGADRPGGTSSSSANNNKSSFVVIGKDGAVRWRNVPQGLHDALVDGAGDGRTCSATTTSDDVISFRGPPDSPAPCEVSLGIAGTYFVRFANGRVDYSLPNFVADAFDEFEADGKAIRNVALHVDTYDCLIRYSMEKDDDDDNDVDDDDDDDDDYV